jgi:hypothetical protein
LVSYKLRDADGRSLGRIEEIIAEIQGTDWVVTEVHIGPGALLERLLELSTLVPFLDRLQRHLRRRYRLRWNQLDFSDLAHPRATVSRGELERIES